MHAMQLPSFQSNTIKHSLRKYGLLAVAVAVGLLAVRLRLVARLLAARL